MNQEEFEKTKFYKGMKCYYLKSHDNNIYSIIGVNFGRGEIHLSDSDNRFDSNNRFWTEYKNIKIITNGQTKKI